MVPRGGPRRVACCGEDLSTGCGLVYLIPCANVRTRGSALLGGPTDRSSRPWIYSLATHHQHRQKFLHYWYQWIENQSFYRTSSIFSCFLRSFVHRVPRLGHPHRPSWDTSLSSLVWTH